MTRSDRGSGSATVSTTGAAPHDSDLHDHDADAVGDDVVQLACDARPLRRDGDARLLLVLVLQPRRAVLEPGGLQPTAAEGAAHSPRSGGQYPHPEHVVGPPEVWDGKEDAGESDREREAADRGCPAAVRPERVHRDHERYEPAESGVQIDGGENLDQR